MSDLFNELADMYQSPETQPIVTPQEDAPIDPVEEEDNEETTGEYSMNNMKEYFQSVDNEEALNYIELLRSGKYISFDYYDKLKQTLMSTESLGEI